jgi:hypothetical protein
MDASDGGGLIRHHRFVDAQQTGAAMTYMQGGGNTLFARSAPSEAPGHRSSLSACPPAREKRHHI